MGTLPDTTTYADSAGDPSAQPAPRAGASVTYVVLDPALAGSNRPRFDTLFSQFKSGYQHAFHGDEAESTDAWLARIMGKDQPQPVMRIVVAVEQDGERVVGGLAVEFYRAAGCALATYHLYILDEPHLRHHGHARRLLETARGAFGGVGTPHLLLAEAEWPEDLSAQGAPASEINAARERLRFFARIGARLINIDYVQPALGPGQKPVSHLRLLAIPPVATPQAGFEDASLGDAVAGFLAEFYAALSQESMFPPDSSTLALLCEQCKQQRPLTSLLPRLREEDAALCFHFVEPLDPKAETTQGMFEVLRHYACPVLHSMETDLLSRAYRERQPAHPERRPLRTVCVTKPPPRTPDDDAGVPVEITFPEKVRFNSENRVEERRWPLRRRHVRAHLAFTAFFEAHILVWHLTLRVDRDAARSSAMHWLDELDLITLQKLVEDVANQEHLFAPTRDDNERTIAKGVEFALAAVDRAQVGLPVDGARLEIQGLLHAVARIGQERARQAAQDLYQDAARVARETPPVPSDAHMTAAATLQLLGRVVSAKPPYYGIEHLLEREALCGIISCILDQMSVATSDGRSIWAFRYSSERASRSLFYSTSVDTLRKQHPELAVLREISDESRLLVSEPLSDLAGVWNEVPESSYAVVQEGRCEFQDFTPIPPAV